MRNISIKREGRIYTTIEVEEKIPQKGFLNNLTDIVREVMESQSFREEDIKEIHYGVEKGSNIPTITIEYATIPLEEYMADKDEKEQIVEVLHLLGYSDEKIRKVKYTKWGRDLEGWLIELSEHYDPDESFSQRNAKAYIYEQLKKTIPMNCPIRVDMY